VIQIVVTFKKIFCKKRSYRMNRSHAFYKFIIFLSGAFYYTTSIANPVPCGSTLAIVAAPVTLTVPGSYKVSQDIAGTITIDADNVELDLNGKRLTAGTDGIVILDHTDITIRNGIIQDATASGIDATAGVNIFIQQIDFIGNSTAILADTVNSIIIDHCTFRNQTTECICFFSVADGLVSNCAIERNTGMREIFVSTSTCLRFENVEICNNNFFGGLFEAVRLDNSQDVRFFDCTAYLNAGDSELNLFRFTGCSNIEVYRCGTVDNNTTVMASFLRGFFVDGSQNVYFDLCVSNSNTSTGSTGIRGFDANDTTQNAIFVSCLAQRNTSSGSGTTQGFHIDADASCLINCIAKQNFSATGSGYGFFYSPSSSNTTTKYCLAKNNKTRGFFNSGGSNNVFLENEAQGHGASGVTNFTGVPSPFINTLDPATDWTSTVTPFNNISVTAP
jgi:hypothetical protein